MTATSIFAADTTNEKNLSFADTNPSLDVNEENRSTNVLDATSASDASNLTSRISSNVPDSTSNTEDNTNSDDSLSSILENNGSRNSESSTTINSQWSEETGSSEVVIVREVQELRDWAVESRIEEVHLDKLLEILRRRLLPDLPKSSKTFLRTSNAKYTIIQMQDANGDDGEFVYFGIRKGLERCVDPETHTGENIELVFDVDGIPLTKSGIKTDVGKCLQSSL